MLLFLSFGALAAIACSSEVMLEAQEVCDNVGWAIASRTLDCTGDAQLANDRFTRFSTEVPCATTRSPKSTDFECVNAAGTASCAETLQLGDDFAAWLARSSTCAAIFAGGAK